MKKYKFITIYLIYATIVFVCLAVMLGTRFRVVPSLTMFVATFAFVAYTMRLSFDNLKEAKEKMDTATGVLGEANRMIDENNNSYAQQLRNVKPLSNTQKEDVELLKE